MIRPEEIEKRIKSRIKAANTNVQLLDANQLKQNKCNCFNQKVYNSKLFNNKSVANSDLEYKYINLAKSKLFNLLTINSKDNLQSKKSKKQMCKTNAVKQTSFFNKIFDYIYIAQCHWLFSLA